MDFRFNETSTSGFGYSSGFNYKPRQTSSFGQYQQTSSGLNTPGRKLQSPKNASTLNSSRKLNASASRLLKDALTLNRDSSRKSITSSSPYKNNLISSKTMFQQSFKGGDRNHGYDILNKPSQSSDFPYQNITTDENCSNFSQTQESFNRKDFRIKQ